MGYAVSGAQWFWFAAACSMGVIVLEILRGWLDRRDWKAARDHAKKMDALAREGTAMRNELHERIRPMRMP